MISKKNKKKMMLKSGKTAQGVRDLGNIKGFSSGRRIEMPEVEEQITFKEYTPCRSHKVWNGNCDLCIDNHREAQMNMRR